MLSPGRHRREAEPSRSGSGWANSPDVTWQDIAEKAAQRQVPLRDDEPGRVELRLLRAGRRGLRVRRTGNALTGRRHRRRRAEAVLRGPAADRGFERVPRRRVRASQDSLDGMINYESSCSTLNASGQLHEPLALIYPNDGIITADYPLMLLNADKRGAFEKLVDVPPHARRCSAWIMTGRTAGARSSRRSRPTRGSRRRCWSSRTFPSTLDVVQPLLDDVPERAPPPGRTRSSCSTRRARWTARGSTR